MQPHPHFDLLLHTDAEIESYFKSALRERQTLHEWPLSCVQRLILADGRRLVYKAQCIPSVEPEFYQRASSPVLSRVETLFQDAQFSCLAMEYLDSARLWDLHLSADDLLGIGNELLGEIRGVKGAYPVYLDIRTWDRWQAVMDEMIANLRELAQKGVYTCVTPPMVDEIARAACIPVVHSAFDQTVGLVHGDLAGDNVFVLPGGGYRIIDWQRPLIGPVALDLAHLADSFGFDPLNWVEPGAAKAFYLLRIQWLVECTTRWYPSGKNTYDATIAKMVEILS